MIRNFFLSVFALFAVLSIATAQNTGTLSKGSKGSTTTSISSTTTTTDPNKLAVEKFGLLVIKSYFDHDCNYLYDQLDNTVKSYENGQVFTKDAALKAQLCLPASNPLRTDIPVTLAMYNQNYKAYVLTGTEFRQKYGAIASQLQIQATDYFFDGSQTIKNGTSVFQAGDMARFIVRKVGNDWKIISM